MNIRSLTPLQYTNELNHLIEEIRIKPIEGKEAAGAELKRVYMKHIEWSEAIFKNLLKMINSNDSNEKLGGLIAVDHLSYVIQENETITFVNRFLSVIFQQFTFNNDVYILKKTAEVFGKLVRMGGTKIAQVVEADVEEALKWLKGDNVKEIRKLGAILALKQLLIEAPYLSFNKIFMNSESFVLIWNIVRQKNILLRETALDFLNVSIKNISQRELNMQTNWLSRIYAEIKKTRSSNDVDTIHGNIIVLRSLLSCALKDNLLADFDEICEYVLSYRTNKNAFIQLSVIETMPSLARFNSEVFCQKYLKLCLNFLLTYGVLARGREKAIFYETLSNLILLLDNHHFADDMPTIMKTIMQELDKKAKPFCIEIIKCLDCLRIKFQKNIDKYAILTFLYELIILNGLYPQSLDFLSEICKLAKDDIWWSIEAEYIQLKLLMTISSTLTGKIYYFPHGSNLEESNLIKFQQSLVTELTSNPEFKKPEAIALSLQALATFDFSYHADSMALFVKEVVLENLDNDLPVIRKAAANAGSLLYIRQTTTGDLTITKNLINEILEKFLSVCLSDPDNSVRETMLASLNENFDVFLNDQRYLKMLFTCLNDPIFKVQENALRIICRLVKYDPSEIVPYIKKKIFQSLNSLNYEFIHKEKDKIEILDLLSCIIEHAPMIISPHADTICLTIISMFNDPSTSNNLIPHVLSCLTQLSNVVKQQLLPYLRDLFPIIIQCMQDMSYTTKRENAIKTITHLIKNTGYVILPYYKYPNLLDTLLYLLKNETNLDIRTGLLRLMGGLGALDAFYYKKIQLRLADTQNTLSTDETLAQDFKSPFMINKRIKKAARTGNQPKHDLITFYNNILFIGDIDKKKTSTTLNLIDTRNLLDSQLKSEERAYNTRITQKTHVTPAQIEELLSSYTPINLSSPEYYTTVSIKALLKVLCDPTLNQLHSLAVDALNVISNTLKSWFANFLHLVVPVFTHLIHTDPNLRELLMHHLEKIIKLCGLNFQEQFVGPVLEYILTYISESQGRMMAKCFETLLTLIQTSKKYLRNKMELITAKLNHIISTYEDAKDIVRSVILIYSYLSEMLDNYLEHIISLLTRIIINNSLQDTDSLINIISFFNICITNCPNTVQYVSKIVQALIFLLDHHQALHPHIAKCFVNMIMRFKNSFLIYLPLINSCMTKYKIQHRVYKLCVEVLLNQGSWQELDFFIDSENLMADPSDLLSSRIQSAARKSFSGDNYNTQPTFPIRATDNDLLLAEFNTAHKNLEEDWIEWMRKSSLELLRQNPYPVVYACHSVAELYPPIARELYNVAFVSCWSILNDKQKETMIKMLTNAINHPNTPVNILQTILNLAEFMQHDREVIPIDISVLGDLAERCLAYAKALYYRELEFEVSPESTIESLIALYTNLGHSEAANGLLVYAKNTLNIELKMSWYENLQRWDEALDAYNAKGSKPGQEYFVSRMRCLSAMSDWETLINDCDPSSTGDNVSEGDKKKQLIQLGANAALKLNRWDTLETYTDNMETNGYEERSFFQAITALRKNKLDKSSAFIKKSREVLDSKVSGLLLESYSRAYDNVIKLQQLFEMEEIIDFQQERHKQLLQTDQLKECPPEKVQAVIEEICSTGKDQKVPYVRILKDQLIEKWNDRLNGCQPSIGVWQEILSVRSILLSKYENLEAWIKFCKLCMKQGQIQICRRTLESVKEDVFKIIPDEEHMPSKLMLVSMECEYANGIKDSKVLINKVCNYLEKQTGIDEIKSKYYLKLGHILKKEQEEMSAESIKEILGFYEKSVEYNKSNYKAWHFIGLMNFEAVEYYKNLSERSQNQNLMKHVAASLEGLVNAIALGSTNVSVSKSFQDTLRLLTLWFDYGGDPKAAEIIKGSFMTLDIVAWIEVVPQLIARFDIPNPTIQDLIHTLLKYIGRHHPQALIYPLAVSLKEKMSARKTAAVKIFEDMKLKYPELIDQALIISEELCRTAILLKEQWSDGIEEACRQYFQERNAEAMLKTLTGLHEIMRSKPQTLSEITFHQSYKAEINEAEAWLNRYIATRDEGPLNQAWDFYHSIFKKISEKSGDKDKLPSLTTIYLENVSPKLLNTKNTDVSVPGLYKPGKPLIKISGFAPKLQVLSSKQHPRKAVIYGSDGKEYTFLLKGHEDTRQDQRVMQLFSLVNRIMSAESTTKKKDLNITTYSVIPLSTRAGLIGWVQNSDPLQMLIREYRENFKIIPNTEMKLLTTMCTKYDLLCLANKVEIFRYVLDNTKGEDLKKVLWLKSPTSEIWLERRTNYTRSLATMSMVGYILGLGDRHPSNIMLQRITGKIVHIDFGDCFEVAMKREKFPEKIPFRLTRMLIKVMEACSIEGTYRATCEDVMRVLRNNKDSLMAVLQAFVYDPLVNWRLLTPSDAKQDGQHEAVGTFVRRSMNAVVASGSKTAAGAEKINKAIVKEFEEMKEKGDDFTKRKEDSREREIQAQFQEDEQNRPIEIVNQRALEVVDRIKKKLTGRDFKEHEVLNVNDQVNQLIKQATSHENICQAYIGWCPFW